jgi:hypothetical protein
MKYLLMGICALALSCTAFAETQNEYNYKLKAQDDWEFTYRHREGNWHTEIGNRTNGIEWMYRYADLNGTKEHRLKFTGEIWSKQSSWGDLTVEGRMEYRYFTNKESHWRWRFITEYQKHIAGPAHLWVKWQPRWAFKDDRTKFDARDQLGIKFKYPKFCITPFVERTSTEGYERKMTVTGVHAEWKL